MAKPLDNLRKKILTVAYKTKEGHIGSSLSILDILWILYNDYYNPNKLEDNVIILSKGHASLGLYAILHEKGFISNDDLYSFCEYDSILGEKFNSFGWASSEVDGHNHELIRATLKDKSESRPRAIIANTIKGNGITRMENQHEWHHKSPNENQYDEIMKELS